MGPTFSVMLGILVLLFGLALLLWFVFAQFGTRARIRRRLDIVMRGDADASISHRSLSFNEQLLRILSALGQRLPLFSTAQRIEMRAKLVMAGYRQAVAMPALMGVSVFCSLIFAVLVVVLVWPNFSEGSTLYKVFSFAAAVFIGSMVPRIFVDKLVARRQRAISDSFPDALDLMVVCANAGLGLNATILRVGQEIEFLAPELADEFLLTAGQLQIRGDTAEVLLAMADRIGLESIRSFVSTLSQSRQYGTPVSEALRVLAASERIARRLRTEEAAAKLATKITLPMMLFILPTVLLVVGAPAVIGLVGSFSQVGN